jgi:CspA family cold shock protein
MNFRDQRLTCDVCERTFIFTVTEQRQLAKSGQEIIPPTQCSQCRTRDPETGRWAGRVKWFSNEKGYGFIVKPNGDEVFFHRSQVVDELLTSLEEGTPVTFDQVSTERGPEANQVMIESPG